MTLPDANRHACGINAAAGSTAIIAAPGQNHRIVVKAFVIQNESENAVVMQLLDGLHPQWRCLGQNQGDGLTMTFEEEHFWYLSPNTALNFDLDGANQCNYSVMYDVERV